MVEREGDQTLMPRLSPALLQHTMVVVIATRVVLYLSLTPATDLERPLTCQCTISQGIETACNLSPTPSQTAVARRHRGMSWVDERAVYLTASQPPRDRSLSSFLHSPEARTHSLSQTLLRLKIPAAPSLKQAQRHPAFPYVNISHLRPQRRWLLQDHCNSIESLFQELKILC